MFTFDAFTNASGVAVGNANLYTAILTLVMMLIITQIYKLIFKTDLKTSLQLVSQVDFILVSIVLVI